MTGSNLKIIFLTLLITGAVSSFGDELEVTSVVNSTRISINDRLVLTVSISGSDANKAGEPQFEPMPDFSISETGTSTQMNIINFKTSVVITYTYVFIPKKTGTFDVGAVSVKLGRNTSRAPATKVEVVSGSIPQTKISPESQQTKSPGDENIFINVFTDNQEPYTGEQITYTFELYNRLSLSDTEYGPPATTGFWTVELQQIPKSIKDVDGKQYYYHVIKTALFPTTSGELIIGPATLTYTTQAGFFSTGPTQTLTTDSINIKAKPLPEQGKPKNFNGAVGKFTISSSANNSTVQAGNVITVVVSVTGVGNLDLITSVTEPDFSEFKTYSPKVAEKISNSGFIVGGTKTWEYIIIPKAQGKVVLQPFTLSYFNPEDKTYNISSTKPLEFNITPGEAIASTEKGMDNQRKSIANIAAYIRYIKPNKSILKSTNRHVYSSVYFYLLYALPLGFFITSYVVKKRQDTIERNTGLKRKLYAWKNAQKRLNEASKMLKNDDAKTFCGKLHESITNYIGDMLNIDTGSLTATGLEKIVTDKGVAPDLAERMRKTMEMCDFIKFASARTGLQVQENILKDTSDIILKLKELL